MQKHGMPSRYRNRFLREERIILFSPLGAFVRAVEGQFFPPGPASSSVVIFFTMGAKEHPDGMKLAKGLELVINDWERASGTYEE